MGSALETLCGQAYGAKQYRMLGIYMQKSWFLLNISVVPMILLFIFATPVLRFLGQDATISKEAGTFALWMIPQQFAYATFIPLSKFLQAQSKVMEMAVIAAFALCTHSILGWFVILKLGWGLPAAAVMLNASWWFMAVAQFLYVVLWTGGAQAWSGFSSKALTNLSGFFKLSVSSALMSCLGMWYMMGVILVAGFLKNAEVSVAALSVCLNILGWASMVGSGFNAAISVRVSNELGSGRSRAAKFAVMVVGITSTLFGLLFALVLLLQRKQYPALFSNDNEVKQLVDELTPMLAVSIIFGCIPLNGVAVGAGWQTIVAYMNVGSYFIFGAPVGILMCYKFNKGLQGLWLGMLSGVCLQTLGVLLLIFLTNWHKEAHVAKKRLKKFEGETLALGDEEN
ncbi:OLC1v1028398C1 [Oldenlandia corymbosa var. corymbosa]|nr:OLC1v1028398C1 [Oldenlandia corymbosa var. corymbosa]